MNYKTRTQQILKTLKTRPRKRMSQNFMVDEGALTAIVDAASQVKADAILEIGSGLGFLTEQLAKLGKPLICVEKDKRFCQYLQTSFEEDRNIKIVEHDILTFPFKQYLEPLTAGHAPQAVCIGNIPYQISSPLLEVLLTHRHLWSTVILTTQKDFAVRLAAKVGSRECGPLSCWMQMHSKIQILRGFKRSCFFPVPRVDSSLIQIDFYENPLFKAEDGFWIKNAIRHTFQKRRKHILNGLTMPPLELNKAFAHKCLEKAGVAPTVRPETLLLEQWIALGRHIREEKSKSA